MDIFTRLLTNNAALSLNENEGYEYVYEGTHHGTEDFIQEEEIEVILKHGYFDAQSKETGCVLSTDIVSDSYKVTKYDGEILHIWKTVENDILSLERNHIVGQLVLIVRDRGFIWSYTDERQKEPLMIVTKKKRFKRNRSW